MTRRAALLVCLIAIWLTGVQPAAGQSVDELVAGNLAAKGGLERMNAIQTIRQISRVTMPGMTAELTQIAQRPNRLRQEILIGGQRLITGFDGSTAWAVNPLTGSADPVILAGPDADMLRDQASFESPLVNYRDKGYTVVLVGREDIDGRPVHHLELRSSSGQIQHCYLDVGTLLETRVVVESPAGSFAQDLSDYRQVEGVTLPFALRTTTNGQVMGEMAVTRVDLNPVLDDAVFRVPD